MRKLIVLVALSLSASAAWAQSSGAASVTKLPGEEKLSVRERAERDFLMPVRRKKAAELAKQQPTASAEQLATAAPENDALSTYSEATPDPRPEEVAVVHEAHTRSRAVRHAAWLAARRERLAEAHATARRATRHSSKSRSTKAKHASKASKATKASARTSKASKSKARRHEEAHRSTRKATTAKKATTHKAAHKATATKSKRHPAAAKTKTKTKPAKRKRH